MKYTLNKIDYYYLLSYAEIKEGDWYYEPLKKMIYLNNTKIAPLDFWKKIEATTDKSLTQLIIQGEKDYFNYDDGKKLNLNKIIPQLHLSQIEALLGKVDVEKLVIEMLRKEGDWSHLFINNNTPSKPYPTHFANEINRIIKGYNQALQDNANKFTLEDMYMLASKVVDDIAKNRGNADWNMFTTPKMIVDEYIKAQKQTEWNVEIETRSKDIGELRESKEGFLNNKNLHIPNVIGGFINITKIIK